MLRNVHRHRFAGCYRQLNRPLEDLYASGQSVSKTDRLCVFWVSARVCTLWGGLAEVQAVVRRATYEICNMAVWESLQSFESVDPSKDAVSQRARARARR